MKNPEPESPRDALLHRRREAKAEYKSLYVEVVEILDRHDPIALTRHGAPSNEYEGEAVNILSRLKGARSADEVRKIVYDVFVRSFNYGYAAEDISTLKYIDEFAGKESSYEAPANDIWDAWQKYSSRISGLT